MTKKSWKVTHWQCLNYKQSTIYRIYDWVKGRCNNKNHQAYKYYWLRWIKCEWDSFEEFYEDMWDSYKEWLTLERINNDWYYCKANCKWATRKEQMRNTRRNMYIEYNWVKKCLAEWLELYNIPYETGRKRIEYWWTIEKTLNTPVWEKLYYWINVTQVAKEVNKSKSTIYRMCKKWLFNN